MPPIAQSAPHGVGGGSTAPLPSVAETTHSSGGPGGVSSVRPRTPSWFVIAIACVAATLGCTDRWARDARSGRGDGCAARQTPGSMKMESDLVLSEVSESVESDRIVLVPVTVSPLPWQFAVQLA